MVNAMMLFVLAAPSVADDTGAIKAWIETKVGRGAGIEAGLQPTKIPEAGALAPVRFYAGHFREFPVSVSPRAPLSQRNVFAVESAGRVRLFTKPEPLADYLRAFKTPITSRDRMRAYTVGWLRLSEVFSQDGYFTFNVPESKLAIDFRRGRASGVDAVEPKGGDRGEITATLTFAKQGRAWRLASIKEARTVQPGVRPICQATKLLDPDPLVRRMAERDLLVIGRRAEGYLREQRAKATPELQRAIDRIWRRILNGDR